MDMVVCEALKYPMMIQLDSCRYNMMIKLRVVRMMMIMVVCKALKNYLMIQLAGLLQAGTKQIKIVAG